MYRIRLTQTSSRLLRFYSYSATSIRYQSTTRAHVNSPGARAAPPASTSVSASTSASPSRVPASSIGLGGTGSGSVAHPAGIPTTAAAGQPGQLNPRQLSAHLDQFVVGQSLHSVRSSQATQLRTTHKTGQERAKKVLAVA